MLLLAIEKTHLLATDVGLFDQRVAHLVGGQDTKRMDWRRFRWRASIQRCPAVPEKAEFDGNLLRLPESVVAHLYEWSMSLRFQGFTIETVNVRLQEKEPTWNLGVTMLNVGTLLRSR